MIDNRKWELAEDFNTKGLPAEWVREGSYRCKKEERILVLYYVSLSIRSKASLTTIGEKTTGEFRKIIDPEDVLNIFNKGGKVYMIEVLAG